MSSDDMASARTVRAEAVSAETVSALTVSAEAVADDTRVTSADGVGIAVGVLVGSLVAVGLGVFGKVHEPQFFALNVAGFSSGSAVKSWMATVAVLLAVFQFGTAFAMYGLFRGRSPSWLGRAHKWSGRLAVLASVPVVVHCLYALGFQATDTRVLFHSLFGCLFYGAFVTKMLLLTRRGLPGWVIPIAGGLLFFSLVFIWLTSSFWFFQTSGVIF